ncbi:MAG TPA: helix-turn-helix transcriptional regulator [Ktedonobacteraceae bacterium]|nr:helix-turn-helix transcriptional regulator [Ktedonobacteraceae bacterium]
MVQLRVKQVAKEKGVSMGKLSRQADLDYNTVKRLFDDPHYSPTIDTLYKVAKVLGVTVNDLIENEKDE